MHQRTALGTQIHANGEQNEDEFILRDDHVAVEIVTLRNMPRNFIDDESKSKSISNRRAVLNHCLN